MAEPTDRTMDAAMETKLTIVVPTYNRYPLLARLLRYYRACGAPVPMHILDSSRNGPPDPEVERLIVAPGITYTRYDADMRPIPKLHEGLQGVTTPYAVLWADDDLMVPCSLGLAAQFLEEHGDFSVAHGRSGLFRVDASKDGRVTMEVGPSFRRSCTDETAAARLRSHVTVGGSLFYSVHRTEWLRQNVERCTRRGFGYYWAELTLAWLAMIQGKAKSLDCLYMLRQMHGVRAAGWSQTGTFDQFDWITRPGFPEQYAAFREELAEELARQDGLSLDDARAVVKEAFWAYLAQVMMRKWQTRYGPRVVTVRDRLRGVARLLPGLRGAWRTLHSVLPGRSRQMSVEVLRRPSSPYHVDFLPIYQAIVQ
ncbi:MAG: TIGR00180 family glycosyltransferase [Candidatus Omnitrophota bacterium]|nr:TIGR00180 family glycosyltransferase [Candidatus Omnitrophota bacterium]